MAPTFKLFSTSSCHLCEKATALLHSLELPELTWEEIEISDDDTLLDTYGTRIPVLLHCRSTQELDWPFNLHDIVSFIAANGS